MKRENVHLEVQIFVFTWNEERGEAEKRRHCTLI